MVTLHSNIHDRQQRMAILPLVSRLCALIILLAVYPSQKMDED